MKEAMLYEKQNGLRVKCLACAHFCLIGPGKKGVCGVRENREGTLFSLVYGKAIAVHVDPIEKKPLFHFFPGSRSLSVATVGCNMRCMNCQNSDISQMPKDEQAVAGDDVPPEILVQSALRARCRSISYTYTEPAIFLEYAYDTARLAHAKGVKNVFVTNGYQSPQALDAVSPFLDAANVDVKAFRDETYRRLCGARLQPVLDTIRRMLERGIWVEITTLLIPGINDSKEEIEDIARFIAECAPSMPWHISRFHPAYLLRDTPPTPLETIETAFEIGKKAGLKAVYVGNLPGEEAESTYCPNCHARLVHRWGFQVMENRMKSGNCPDCGAEIRGRWRDEPTPAEKKE